jgi:hypothetical protein
LRKRRHRSRFFFTLRIFSKNILAILVKFALEKNRNRITNPFLLLKSDKFCEEKCSNFFFLSFFLLGGWVGGGILELGHKKEKEKLQIMYILSWIPCLLGKEITIF